jgi:peptide/nickel transport system substrate-binding protein
LFNNLVTFDPAEPKNSEASLRPDLAESWSWNQDKTELTFKLRRGVKWHDGWPFTANDVECTFNLLTGRARDRLRSNPRAAWFGNINYVHGRTDHEVTLHLNHPQPSLLLLASGLTPIYPCHVPTAQMRVKPIGTGPFKLDSFKQFDSIRLARNPDYFKPDRPWLDRIEFRIVAGSALLSFVAGGFDMTFPFDVSTSQLRDVRRQSPRAICETTPMNSSLHLLLNRDAAPFDRPEVRRALTLAIDRRALVTTLNDGEGDVGGVMQPPPDGLWGLPPEQLAEVPGFGPDVERSRTEARELLAKAGYGPDKPLRLKVATRALAVWRTPASLLIDQLREVGIEGELDIVEATHWLPRLERRDYALAVDSTANAIDDPDQSLFENYACRSERNFSRYCNGEIERLFERQSAELDPEKRRQMVWDIDRRLLADAARPPLAWTRRATCWQPHVKGYVQPANSMYNAFRFEDVWLER